MKKLLYILSGAILFAFIGFLFVSGLTWINEQYFAQSQNDMDTFASILLITVFPLFIICGGALGWFIYRNGKQRNSRSPVITP